MIICSKSYARAGLIGNPSDGYYGKTVSFIVRNFSAEVVLYETPELKILPSERDHSVFANMGELGKDVRNFGYYGGIRLLKATVKRFHDYCVENQIKLDDRNFTIRYSSDIPPHVGMAGSSAIITACLRGLMTFYGITISRQLQAILVLSVENEELGIPAGLQDRVIQAYEGLVYMDFERDLMEQRGYGRYEELSPDLLPPLYIAYSTKLSGGTEVFHNDIRARFDRGEEIVVESMAYWADLADQVKQLLLDGESAEMGPLLNANFDRRREIYQLSENNLKVVETARAVGASCKFTGSGGAFVGTYEGEEMYRRLVESLGSQGIEVIKPIVKEDES